MEEKDNDNVCELEDQNFHPRYGTKIDKKKIQLTYKPFLQEEPNREQKIQGVIFDFHRKLKN